MSKRPHIPARAGNVSRGGALAVKQKQMQQLAARFRAAMAAGDHGEALKVTQQALRFAPNNMTVLGDHALCLMRTGAYDGAYQIYRRIYNAPEALQAQAPSTWLDGLAEVCGWLGKADELRQYGHQALAQADARYRTGHRWLLPETPPAFDRNSPERNIIAYSLFGANPKYCETAVMNVVVARDLFPAWTCRIYLDSSVPKHVQHRLRDAGAQVVAMNDDAHSAIPATLWRFLVMDDPGVDRFLVRDADALLSEREVPAVEDWLESGRFFHHMRDYFTHTELLLAGMWGGCTRAMPAIEPMIRDYVARHDGSSRFTDQYFLREIVWPTARSSILNHDEIFGFHGARPFPAHAPLRWQTDRFHVGSNAAYQRIGGPSTRENGAEQPVELVGDALTDIVYHAPVRDGNWSITLPFFLVDALKTGRLRAVAHTD
jgi:hypothetical protein